MAEDILPPKRPSVRSGKKETKTTTTKVQSKKTKSPSKKVTKKVEPVIEEVDDYYAQTSLEPPQMDANSESKPIELFDGTQDLEESLSDESLVLKDSSKPKKEKHGFLSGLFGKKKETPKEENSELSEDDLHNIREALGVNKGKKKSIQKDFEDSLGGSETAIELKELAVEDDDKKDIAELGEVTDSVGNDKSELDETWGVHSESELESSDSELKPLDTEFHIDPDEEMPVATKTKNSSKSKVAVQSENGYVDEPEIKLNQLEKAAQIDKEALVSAVHESISEHDDQERIMKKIDKELTKAINARKKEFLKTIKEKTNAINAKSKIVNKSLADITSTKKENEKLLKNIDKEKEIFEKEKEKLAQEKKLVSEKTKELNKLEKQKDSIEKKKNKFLQDIEKLKVKKQDLQKNIQEKQNSDNKLIESLTQQLHMLSQETEKAERLHKAKMERYKKELSDIDKQLKASVKKSEDINSKLTQKEQLLDKKTKELKILVEEEKHMVEILGDSSAKHTKHTQHPVKRKTTFAETPAFAEEPASFDALSDESDEDSLHQRIYDCKQILAEGKLDDAMLLYNELVDEFSEYSGSYSFSEKREVKQKLKDLYQDINMVALRM